MAGFDLYGALTQWYNDTGPLVLTGPKETVNDAVKINYNTMGYLLRGQPMSQTLQGGATIKDQILLGSGSGDVAIINPGQTMNPQIIQAGTYWTIPWRLMRSHWGYLESELDLQGLGEMSWQGAFQKFKDVLTDRKRVHDTNYIGKMEDFAWATPDKSKMEGTSSVPDGGAPCSIPAMLNEFGYTVSTSTGGTALFAPGTSFGGTWTTVQGITPSATAGTDGNNWIPYQSPYKNVTVDDPNNLIATFDDVEQSIDFKPPQAGADKQYFEAEGNTNRVIFCSKRGINKARQLYRASNDRWDNMKDPYLNPMFGGWSFVHVAVLDSASLYPTGTSQALSTETDTTNNGASSMGWAGPRYYCVNTEYLRGVFHSQKFKKPYRFMDGGVQQPDLHIQYYDTLFNFVCRSRKRHAMVFPTANI